MAFLNAHISFVWQSGPRPGLKFIEAIKSEAKGEKMFKNVDFELFFEMITIFFHAIALSAATPLRPLLYIWCGGDRKLYYIPPWRQNSALSWREVLRESSHCDHILIFQGACWRFFFISFFYKEYTLCFCGVFRLNHAFLKEVFFLWVFFSELIF